MRKNPGELSAGSAFNTDPTDKDGGENPGFGITLGSGLGLKRIYNLWYVQHHQKLISEADRKKFLSDDCIGHFLKTHSLPDAEMAEGEEPESERPQRKISLSEQTALFKRKIADDPNLCAEYFALCKIDEVGTDIPCNDEYIGEFLDFMGLRGLPATRTISGTTHPVGIDTALAKELLDGNIKPGIYLKRYMQVKVWQNFILEHGEKNISAYVKNYSSDNLDIEKALIPSLGIVADTLWQARINQGLSTEQIGIATETAEGNLRFYETGTYNKPKSPYLHKILTFYGRTDLYDNAAFMAPILKTDKKRLPFSYQLKLERYRKGLSAPQVAGKVDLEQYSISRYENGNRMPEPSILRKLLEIYGRLDLYNDNAFMAPVLKTDKRELPFSYQLKLERYRKGLDTNQITGLRGDQIDMYEADHKTPSPAALEKLCKALGWNSFDARTLYKKQQMETKTSSAPGLQEADKDRYPFAYQLKLRMRKPRQDIEQLAEKTGVTVASIERFKNGAAIPDTRTLMKLCRALQWDRDAAMSLQAEQHRLDKLHGTQERYPFAYQLGVQRHNSQLDVTQVAQKIGVTTSSVERFESGTTMPDTRILMRLCRALQWDRDAAMSLHAEQHRLDKLYRNHAARDAGYER